MGSGRNIARLFDEAYIDGIGQTVFVHDPGKTPTHGDVRSALLFRHLPGETRRFLRHRRQGSPRDSLPGWLLAAGGVSWRLLVIVLVVAMVFAAMNRIQFVLVSVFIALVLTSVLRPLTDFFHRFMPRVIATTLAMLSAVGVLAGLVGYVITSVAGKWNSLMKQVESGLDTLLSFAEDGPLPITITQQDIDHWIKNGREWLTDHSGDIASQAAARAGTLVEIFAALALAIFCTVFFLSSGRQMWTWCVHQLPFTWQQKTHSAGVAAWNTFSGYVRGTFIIAITDGIFVGIYLALLGVPLAVPLAVLVFIGAFIPIIGAPVAMLVAAVVALATGGIVKAIFVVIGIALIGQFEGHVLQPLIMGKQVSLHPVVVALTVTSGTVLAGIMGAVVAVPLVAVVWAVYSTLRVINKSPDFD